MTIPKNTNKARAILACATDIRCYSLSNNFSGQPLADSPVVWGPEKDEHGRSKHLVHATQPEFLAHELQGTSSTKLRRDSQSGRYVTDVHSNLWYEFQSA